MSDLQVAQKELANAEAKLREKEHDWFVIRFIVMPTVLALVAALAALTWKVVAG